MLSLVVDFSNSGRWNTFSLAVVVVEALSNFDSLRPALIDFDAVASCSTDFDTTFLADFEVDTLDLADFVDDIEGDSEGDSEGEDDTLGEGEGETEEVTDDLDPRILPTSKHGTICPKRKSTQYDAHQINTTWIYFEKTWCIPLFLFFFLFLSSKAFVALYFLPYHW